MSANLDALVQGIRAKRSEKLPQAKARLEKLRAAKQAVLNTRTRAASVAGSNPELQTKLSGISYDNALKSIDAAIEANERSVSRLSRESINIGVAGKARQGKSQILQMLTGLSDKQIPTGDGGFCTGARSVIRNSDFNRAMVYFKTEADIIERIILPACRSLDVSPCPVSVGAFIQSALPNQPEGDADRTNEWNNLFELQRDLRNNPCLVSNLGAGPLEVNFEDLRRYVTKDSGDKEFQVVDHLEVDTPFDSGLPKGMLVYDLPGLRDPAPGIRESMLKSIEDDSDIVLLMRRPESMGDGWGDDDKDIVKMLQKVYVDDDIKPKDWLLLVMNHVREHRNKDGEPVPSNEKNLDAMLDEVSYKYPGFHAVKCDCGSKDAVRAMVNENVEVLIQQTSRIDDLRIRQSDEKYTSAMNDIRDLYHKLQEASFDIVAIEFDFKDKFEEFMSDLREPFKKGLSPEFLKSTSLVLETHFKNVSKRFKELYSQYDSAAKFPPEFPVFSKRQLTNKFGAGRGPTERIDASIRNQREALLHLLRSELTKCCGELIKVYLDNVVEIGFDKNKAICMVISESAEEPLDSRAKIEKFLAMVRMNGTLPTLEAAILDLLSFQLTFDSAILPAIYGISELNDFNPERKAENGRGVEKTVELKMVSEAVEQTNSREERAEILYNWQKERCVAILCCASSDSDRSPLFSIKNYVANAMLANFDAFVFRLIWGDTCEDEWECLAKNNRATFWKEDFEKANASSALAREWSEALSQLRALAE